MEKQVTIGDEKRTELVAKFKEFVHKVYDKELIKAVNEDTSLNIDFDKMDKYKDGSQLCGMLLEEPDTFMEIAKLAMEQTVLPSAVSAVTEAQQVKVRFFNLPEDVNIRDLRSKHLNKLSSIEGIVRRASEVRPEITETIWECTECGDKLYQPVKVGFISKPFKCNCGNRIFKQTDKKLIDARWITVGEPFELTEGEKPSQVNLILTEDLVSPEGRRMSDPGNRLRITGILREMPKSKTFSAKLDIFMEANHVEPKETGWERIEIGKEEEAEIKKLTKDPKVYDKLVASLAPSLYGMKEIKESIILQLFGGVPRIMKDNTKLRGDIHILLVGDPASGKSMLLKLTPTIVPRGNYVSGKGTTAAGLCTVYDTIIQTGDGKLTKIGDLVENKMKNNMKEEKPGIFTVEGDKEKILSFDSNNMKIKPKRITKYWKIKAPSKLVKIITQTGKEIIITPDNPIPVLNKGLVFWKKAIEIKRTDQIACPRILHQPNNKTIFIDLIDGSARALNSDPVVERIARKIMEKTTIRDYMRKTGISENSLYYSWRNDTNSGSPGFNNLVNMCNDFGINKKSYFPRSLLLSQYNGHKISVPKEVSEDFMYLIGLIAGDGSISKTGFGGYDIKFSNSEEWLLKEYKRTCMEILGIEPSYRKVTERIPYLRFSSKIFANILRDFGIPDGKKSHKIFVSKTLSLLPNTLLGAYLQGIFDTDGSVMNRNGKGSNVVELDSVSENFIRGVQILLLRFGIISSIRKRKRTISMIKGRKIKSSDKWTLEIRGYDNIKTFNETIGFRLPRKSKKLLGIINNAKPHTNIDLIPGISRIIKEARKELGISAKDIFGYKNYTYESGTRVLSRKMLKYIVKKLRKYGNNKNLKKLATLASSDIIWEKPKKIEVCENNNHDYVYDVTVEDEHSFIANGTIIHNTATVSRDEMLGGWVLEAGAMVLSNKGILSVDEFEKMDDQDQVAMHEALEQGSVSIAKASIMATLPAQTSVLAGANPKFSRFDSYRSIAEQINIVDTLLSRFDLKFVLRDIPNAEQDKKVVEHILKAREGDYKEAEPVIKPDLIRKFVAYSKSNCQPKLTPEVGKTLKEFYLRTRKKAEGGNAPIPITLRQFEALMRLAEASAKIQLSDYVRKEDAQRAIRLMQFSLRQLGYDPETGSIDVDKSEGATSYSERSKLRKLLDIITELSAKKKEIPLNDLEAAAKKDGIDNIDELLERLKREGMLFEPSPGFVQKI